MLEVLLRWIINRLASPLNTDSYTDSPFFFFFASKKILHDYSDDDRTLNAKGIANFQFLSLVVVNIVMSNPPL